MLTEPESAATRISETNMRRASLAACLVAALLLTQCRPLCGEAMATERNHSNAISSVNLTHVLPPIVLSDLVVGLRASINSELPEFVPVAVNAQCKEIKATSPDETHVRQTVEQCAKWCLANKTCTFFVHYTKVGACALIAGDVCTPGDQSKAGTMIFARSGSLSANANNKPRSTDDVASNDHSNWQCIAPQNSHANRSIVWRTR